ncbi:GntR family transcriptional regulator [Pullulanibacillus pueri]|uniref:GntR family transcriptional regulator n=1 Tax=Pullulanibacillus pueri TaxID=1437324 RepID=A0A8J2ZYH4_9BACL|nr:GntR family transcriptional regulator [Pullulanibacillus pueri]MBM7683369.1 GntR family transcriptional regulator [Pullulanibacillus pueri]GGH86578.1 GntR family transcriptional regulator [Pullulanibacillus pueri]
MNIAISNTSEKPIYQQLFEQISAQILKGDLESGYGLPPIRQAAKELGVSIITVKKAWEELERLGLINTITGKGCFVAEFSSDEMVKLRNEMVLKQMVNDLSYYKSFGLTLEEMIELLKQAYDFE